MKKIFLVVGFAITIVVQGQVGIQTNQPKSTLDVSAKRDNNGIITDNSLTYGFQVPRLTRAELTNLTTAYGVDQKSALIYVTDITGGNINSPRTLVDAIGFYYWDGSLWQKLTTGITGVTPAFSIGDLKNSFQTTDHSGWYLLDGRVISGLPISAQSAATTLGFSASLPNATDRMLKTKNATESLGQMGGVNTLSLTQANLPNITLSGSISGNTNNSGGHSHTPPGGVGSFLLGGTSVGNNGMGHYTSNTNMVPAAWGGVGIQATTSTNGNHAHTVSGTATIPTGGSGTALDNKSPYIVVNTFIYLGQ